MKKTLLLALALMSGASTAALAASPIVNNPANEPYLGVRLSAEGVVPGNLSYSNKEVNNFDAGAGISVGFVYNQPIVANFTVEPGLELYYNTTKFNLDDAAFQSAHWKSHSTRSFGMRVPVMLGYHFDFSKNFSLNVATGPVLKDNVLTGAGLSNAFNRVDCAWRISMGANFLDHYYIGLSGDLGMVNQIKHSNNGAYDMKNNLFQFTLGYNF